ncbi:MAG TPA: sugar O-acetyltransferase [Pseudomonadales bacterium]|nr:sugar O-acetyltransferase [Pseudomonadales bacterium]
MVSSLTGFDPFQPQHLAARKRAKQLCRQINMLPVQQLKARRPLYEQLFGVVVDAFIEPDFYCDYGYNIHLGEKFYANHHCVMLDAAEIRIGHRVLLGPSVHLYTTTHPVDASERATGKQLVAPIVIGDDCWIGGNAVIMPGVTIGMGTVIGAGSVVTASMPAGVVAYGNPCRVIRPV